MKKLLYDSRKLGILVIIIGLMLVLIGIEIKFDERIKLAILIQNNISSLKRYSAYDEKFTYKLPSDWKTQEQSFSGNEVLYHNDFLSQDSKIYGFVQIWNKGEKLNDFLDKSRRVSEKQNNVKGYNRSSIKIDKSPAYLVSYEIINRDNISYIVHEYFIDDKQKFFRFSFFVRKENFNPNMVEIFDSIVKTMEFKG